MKKTLSNTCCMREQSRAPRTINYVFIIIGTIVGAGFFSGREIAEFFSIFGAFAPAVALAYGLLTYCGLSLCLHTTSSIKDRRVYKFFKACITIASLVSLTSMIAGLASIIEIMFGTKLPFWIVLIVCFFILTKGIHGISKTNIILMPATIILLASLSLFIVFKNGFQYSFIKTESSIFQILTYPLLYFGLNIFTCFPIAQEFAATLTKRQKRSSSIIIAIILTILIILIQFSILHPSNNYSMYEIPILILTIENLPEVGIIVSLAISIGIITTLLSCGFILQNSLNSKINNIYLATLIPLAVGTLLSSFGFSNIVKFAYPITGALGVGLILYLCFISGKNKLFTKQKFCAKIKNKKMHGFQ